MWRPVVQRTLLSRNCFPSSRRFISTDPNLTLFSGPTCSLCDDAKVILNDVKKQRPFNLKTIDIHSKGQEKWKRRYVYTIPVLHLEDKVIAQERWDAESVRTAIVGWKSTEKDSSTEADAE